MLVAIKLDYTYCLKQSVLLLDIAISVPYAPPATPIDAPRIAKIVPVSVIVLVPSLCILSHPGPFVMKDVFAGDCHNQ